VRHHGLVPPQLVNSREAPFRGTSGHCAEVLLFVLLQVGPGQVSDENSRGIRRADRNAEFLSNTTSSPYFTPPFLQSWRYGHVYLPVPRTDSDVRSSRMRSGPVSSSLEGLLLGSEMASWVPEVVAGVNMGLELVSLSGSGGGDRKPLKSDGTCVSGLSIFSGGM
jgi:hypothetical protein